MIDFSVLSNCLLQACFFKQHDGKVTKSEQQKKANKLEQVTYEHAAVWDLTVKRVLTFL